MHSVEQRKNLSALQRGIPLYGRFVAYLVFLVMTATMVLLPAAASFAAGDLSLFGPKRYERLQGKPWAFTDSFNGCANSAGQALLRVQNGAGRESSLSSAVITLNGTNVLVEADFKNQTPLLERTVTILPGVNTIATQLKSGGQKETPFLVVTVIGLGCDSTPPLISAPQPPEGALLTVLRPAIAASYADNSGGAGIDTASVRVTLDGGDITPACTAGGTSVSCTLATDLPEGGHSVTVAIADQLQNPAALSWRFTTDTIAPVAAITTPVNNQYLSSRSVTVSGRIDDQTATVTVNGKAATISGALFSVADVPLTEGANTLILLAVDPAGNRSESSITVTVDTSLPRVTVTAPLDGSFTAASPINVSGTVSEPPVSVLVNGRQAAVAGQSFTLTVLPLAEGLNSLTVEAVDQAGNKGTAIVTVNLDTVKPQLFITTPADGILTRSPSLTVSGTVSEPVSSLTLNGNAVAVAPDLTFSETLTLSEGQNTITVEAIDRAGNSGETTRLVNLDSTAPTAPALEGLTTPTNLSPVTVNGSAEPWSSVSLYNNTERVATIVTPDDGRFSFPEMVLHEGENRFTATALDLAGNESAPSAPVTVLLDTVKPLVGITAPLDKALLNTPVITLSGPIDDPTAAVTVNGIAALNSGGVWSLAGFTLQEGVNSLLVEARDPAGNPGSTTIAVTLDTILPAVTIASPVDGLYTNMPTQTVSGSVSEQLASLMVNGSPVPLNDLTFSSTITLVEGVNTIIVEATDMAGNKGQGSVTVNLDTFAPQLSVIGPADGALLNNGQITFGASAGEPVVSVTVNGSSAPLTAGTNGYTLPVTLSEGTNELTVTAVDKAGNSTTTTYSVILDSTPPVVAVLTPAASALVTIPQIIVSGTVSEPVTSVTVNGVTASLDGSSFSASITLAEGANAISVTALDKAGNSGTASASVTLDTVAPVITVAAPAANSFLSTPQLIVSGTVSESVTSVTVNGVTASLDGNSFSATITLAEGAGSITVTALDKAGNSGITTVPVTLDTLAPTVTIATPANGLLTKTAQVTVSGSISEENTSVTVNGQPATVSGLTFTAPFTLAEGSNSITVKATDRAGNSGTASTTVQLDATAPAAPLLTPLPTPTNAAIVTVSGTAEAGSTVKISAAGALVASVTADAQGAFALADVALAEGANSYSAVATDAAGNDSAPSAPLNVTLDTVKPVISVTAPLAGAVISSAEVTISGSVSEPLATLTINGAAVAADSNSIFSSILPLAAGSNSALITATDLAGNVATTTLTILRDSTPPVVVISAPQAGLLTRVNTVQVSGSVDDAEALLSVNGAAVTNSTKTFSFSYTLSDGQNTISVEATDKAGNKGTAATTVTLDAQPPQITLNAPAEATAGANIVISLSASDNRQLALVELKVDGVPIWSGSSVPAISETVSYRLSPTLNAGAAVALQAKGIDTAGNEASASATISITQAAMGPGYLQGKVLEDSRGLKLVGAEVFVTHQLNNATNALITAADGGYFLETPAGGVLVKVAKLGYTTVERTIPVIPEKNSTVLDARLTKIHETKNLVDAAGGTVRLSLASPSAISPQPSAPSVELILPAGAVNGQADLRLTPISNQGLAGLLPLGWSPLAALDIRSLDPATGATVETTFSAAATVKLPLPAAVTIDPAAPPVLVRYDESVHQWLAAGTAVSDTVVDSTIHYSLFTIHSVGQYALVLPDPAPAAPPTPVMGQPLQPSALSLQPDFTLINATGKVVPQAAPPSAGLKAAGEVVLTAEEGTTPVLTSGLILASRITEKFDLKAGDTIESPVYNQDIVLYRYPCVTSIGNGAVSPLTADGRELRTTFPVSPSKDYTIVDLLLGKVGIEIIKPDTTENGVMVGPDGGRLVDADGNILNIPQGALSQTTPVSTKIAPAATGAVGADFTLIRAVEVNLTRQTLAQAATLSIPAPQGLDQSLPLVVARQIDVKGVAKLKLVSLARQSGTLISSEPLTQPLNNSTTQLNTSGVYYFLQAKAPIGFVIGTVSDSGSAPFTGALVKSDSGSLVDLSTSAGKYLLAAPVAPFSATATDLYKGDEISVGSLLTAANQVVTVDLRILMVPPRIASITPANGAVKVQPDVPVVVTFSKAMDKSSVNSTTLRLNDGAGAAVPGVMTWDVAARTLTFYPAEVFKQETTYHVTISGSAKDLQGYPLGQDTISSFTVRRTTPPVMPAAGAVSATFPDSDGFITVTATQGSADPANTVLLINDTTGEITSVTPQSNGSFTGKVRGQLGDEIKVVLMDYSGNQTTVSYLTFKGADGSYLVTAKGGKVEGEGGSVLDIPEGALVGPAVVKVTAVPQEGLPTPLQAPGQYLSAFNIDSGGIPFKSEVKLSIPLPAGFNPATPVFVTRPAEVMNDDGTVEKVYEIIDSTKVVNGRITTASPPFDGIMGFGSYAFTAFPEVNVGIVDGYTYQEMNDQPGYQPTADGSIEIPAKDAAGNPVYKFDKPVPRAVIRTPAAWNYVSYANSKGFYAGMTTLSGNVGATDLEYKLTAIHPLTMQRETKTGYLTVDGNQSRNISKLNFKLADKGTIPLDKEPPVIRIEAKKVAGQGADAYYSSGLAVVGTELAVTITVSDKSMGPATLIMELSSEAYANMRTTPLTLEQPTVTAASGMNVYTYTPDFHPYFSGSSKQTFKPLETGLFRLVVSARDAAGNLASKNFDVKVIGPGEQPLSLAGAPTVGWHEPQTDAIDVMIDAPVKVLFSEAVTGVDENSFTLFDLTAKRAVPAAVIPDISNGQMKVLLVPKNNLAYGHTYRVNLTGAITDLTAVPLAPVSWQFTTRTPLAAELAGTTFAARDIDYYYDTTDGSTYACVAAGLDGWRVVDVTETNTMAVVWPAADFKFPAQFDYRNLAVDQQNSLLAMTDNFHLGSSDYHYGYVRFYSLADPKSPVMIGREKLAEAMSGIPGRVVLQNGYAYVNTIGVGVQIVDIQATIDRQKTGGASDGSAIVGYFDTNSPTYFGSPNVFAAYRSNAAVLTTTTGQLLTLDLSFPNMPQLVKAYKAEDPDSTATPKPILRFAAMAATADFAFRDPVGGNLQMFDLAVTGLSGGGMRIVNLTDPFTPAVIGTVKNLDNSVPVMVAREITINSVLGLAVAVALDGVYVIDIRNPYDPRVLNKIVELASGAVHADGTPVMIALNGNQAVVEKDGTVYLANPASGVKAINLGAGDKISCNPNIPCAP